MESSTSKDTESLPNFLNSFQQVESNSIEAKSYLKSTKEKLATLTKSLKDADIKETTNEYNKMNDILNLQKEDENLRSLTLEFLKDLTANANTIEKEVAEGEELHEKFKEANKNVATLKTDMDNEFEEETRKELDLKTKKKQKINDIELKTKKKELDKNLERLESSYTVYDSQINHENKKYANLENEDKCSEIDAAKIQNELELQELLKRNNEIKGQNSTISNQNDILEQELNVDIKRLKVEDEEIAKKTKDANVLEAKKENLRKEIETANNESCLVNKWVKKIEDKKIEMDNFMQTIEQVNTENLNKLKQKEINLTESKNQIADLEQKTDSLKEQIKTIEEQITNLDESIKECIIKNKKNEVDKNLLFKKLTTVTKDHEEHENNLKNYKEISENLTKTREELELKIEDIDKKIEETREKVNAAQNDDIKSETKKLTSELTNIKEEIKNYNAKIEIESKEYKKLKEFLEKAKAIKPKLAPKKVIYKCESDTSIDTLTGFE